ncbi:proprotein convertase P [Sediminicola sp. YIK13]|uniref:reprolysin-like metallopeptidase n=1 Tax=Sediminicola sp. YIK13 TaxID=1453352 RepID=UPI00071F943A|nr:zinc-dependent metalloprotease family protein [Sediminicola sp. YIK13]ALM08159.1 proprotein convertase P [Sediminicola sp. YIK13]
MNTKLHLVFSITILFLSFYGSAQTNYWERETSRAPVSAKSLPQLDMGKAAMFSLRETEFNKELPTAKQGAPSKILYFPNEKGELEGFKVVERSIMSPELAAKYPQIKSFVGQGLSHPEDRIRFSVSHKGVQSMIVHGDSDRTTFMQKASVDGNDYVVYSNEMNAASKAEFICNTTAILEKNGSGVTQKLVDDQQLRKYRLAISATGEYTVYHGGTKTDALAAINATVTRINEVMETDLGVTLELIANNDLVIYTDAATDPYNGNLNNQVQNTLTTNIGEANYDVGHLFHKDSNSGNAGFIGAVCQNNKKGSGYSSAVNPEGDLFDLDFVAHELGHQFGANHTWSFESEGTGVQAEPGSGSTIMGYAGIAEANNVASNGDDYYHYYSIFQIVEYLKTTSCAEIIPLTNATPTIAPVGNFVIPKSTAFVLTGSATDADVADVLTYTWEQIDDGVVTNVTFGPTNPSGANFRSLKPSTDPTRYFPKLSRVIQGSLTQVNPTINSAWETVSDVARELNFAFTVRDNAVGGGQVNADLVKVEVINSAGPFILTSQASNEVYDAGSVQDITWDVANTNSAPVNANTVDILLSTDGGLTFPIVLASDVPNDGLHPILLPGNATSSARIMVKAHDNIFFAVNSSNFTIQESPIVLEFGQLEFTTCQPLDWVIPFTYRTYLGFNEEVTFSTSGVPVVLNTNFSPTTATADNTSVTLTLSNTGNLPEGSYPIEVIATSSGGTSRQVQLLLKVYDATFPDVTLTAPADGLVGVSLAPQLTWQNDDAYDSYDIEVARDASFVDIVDSRTVIFNSYIPAALEQDTTYYWRVKPRNSCGEGTFGAAFSFTTKQINCQSFEANDLPISITSVGTPVVTSKITFFEDLPIADVNVNLNITHTYLEDLVISLISPAGTKVVLTSSSCGSLRNINATFDDDGSPFTCSNNPAISGVVRPLGSLSSFNGESLFGEWTLEIRDNAPSDGGSLNAFSLDICVEGTFRPDADEDGVFDDGDDLCLGTPKGLEVDVNGCAIYRLPKDNFLVEIQSESCRNNNDGAINITADQTLDYAITIVGNGINEADNFTTTYGLATLPSGTFQVCIVGASETVTYEEYCFEVVVAEPDPLSVYSKISADGKRVTLDLEGSALYSIELNGVVQQTSKSEVTLDLKNGTNILKVYTNIPCQGVYEEELFVAANAVLYPNPVVDRATLFFGAVMERATIRIYSLDGTLVRSMDQVVTGREMQIDLSGLASGIYILTYDTEKSKGTYKVIKK